MTRASSQFKIEFHDIFWDEAQVGRDICSLRSRLNRGNEMISRNAEDDR